MSVRGYTIFDFRRVIKNGCRVQEGEGGHWRFTYNRVLVITDSDVEVGITMYRVYADPYRLCLFCDERKNLCACGICKFCCLSSNHESSSPRCSDCGWKGKDMTCEGGVCTDCCDGCDSCIGEECPKCKRKEIDLLCDKGLCPECCDGCLTCAGETCPQCGTRGMDILCYRGFCQRCCWGCNNICSCPCCHRKTDLCERGFCRSCCYGCDICAGEECPKCNRKAIDLLCDKGLCPKCCDGCMKCAGEYCPGCGTEGIDILCKRGYCNRCCWGCDICYDTD